MSITTMQETVAAPRLAATLLPIMGVVFVAFLVIGVAMPVLPLHVHDGLGLGTFVVGLVAGSQFAAPLLSVAILLLGRGLLGSAESFIITAAVSWGLALADARSTGKVIAWVGSAMFAAFAIGAPAGSGLYAAYGFGAIAFGTAAAPLLT